MQHPPFLNAVRAHRSAGSRGGVLSAPLPHSPPAAMAVPRERAGTPASYAARFASGAEMHFPRQSRRLSARHKRDA